MKSNRLAFIGLAFACIVAAFGGGYLASRQNTVPVPAAALESTTSTPSTRSIAPGAPAAKAADRAGQEAAADITSKTSQPATAKRSEPVREPAPQATRAASAARTASAPPSESAAVDRTPPVSAPVSSTAPLPVVSASTVDTAPPAPGVRPADRPGEEQLRPSDPPQKTLVEVVVPANAVIGLQTENGLSSETAHVEDRVEARVMRDVKIGDEVAIPAGARAIGSVTQVEIGGKFKERARLGVRFHTVVLADGTQLPIKTVAIDRYGEAPGDSTAAKVGGGAVAGAIIGAILGGSKGAAAGAAAGAGGGAVAVAAGDRKPATMPAGMQVTVQILSPVTVILEK